MEKNLHHEMHPFIAPLYGSLSCNINSMYVYLQI